MKYNLTGVFFSPTGGTRGILEIVCRRMASSYSLRSYTLPIEREALWDPFTTNDAVVWASPVYAGRLPNKTLDFVTRNLRGSNTPIVLVAVYGGRHFDNALSEMALIARQNGFRPIAAAAIVARHAFSKILSEGRPSDNDVAQLEAFADSVDFSQCGVLELPGETLPSTYYTPLREDLTPARFLKALPVVDDAHCSRCGICASLCPMGSITVNHSAPQFQGVCIKCQACVRCCPQHAVWFDDADFLSHVRMLETTYTTPAPNHFFTLNN